MYDFLVVIQGSYQEIRYGLYDIIYDPWMTTKKWQPGITDSRFPGYIPQRVTGMTVNSGPQMRSNLYSAI